MVAVEALTRAILSLRHKTIIVNGGQRQTAPRVWEGLGIWTTPEDVRGAAKAGDILIVRGRNNENAWAKTTNPKTLSGYDPGTSYQEVFRDCLKLANEKNLGLCLARSEKPDASSSMYSLHPLSDPATWDLAAEEVAP